MYCLHPDDHVRCLYLTSHMYCLYLMQGTRCWAMTSRGYREYSKTMRRMWRKGGECRTSSWCVTHKRFPNICHMQLCTISRCCTHTVCAGRFRLALFFMWPSVACYASGGSHSPQRSPDLRISSPKALQTAPSSTRFPLHTPILTSHPARCARATRRSGGGGASAGCLSACGSSSGWTWMLMLRAGRRELPVVRRARGVRRRLPLLMLMRKSGSD